MTMANKPPTPPTPDAKRASPDETPKPRVTSNGVLAGRLYERIAAWAAECDAEVKASPEQIKLKWANKIKAELAKADPFVRELAEKMLRSDEASNA